jgi:uncharacterized membrane protein YdjX (TVP38/TMEM64 family)
LSGPIAIRSKCVARPAASGREARQLWPIALFLAAGVVLLLPGIHDRLLGALDAAGEVIRQRPVAGMAVFVLLAALSAMVAFLSSAVLIPVAVHVWGPAACAVLLWTGWFLGGLAAYAVGRYLGRPVVERLIRPEAIARYEGWTTSEATLVPILLLQLAVPSDVAGYVFGLVRCRPGVFMLALALAEVPYALGAVYLGLSFLQRNLIPLLLGLLGLLGLAVGAWAVRRACRKRRKHLTAQEAL